MAETDGIEEGITDVLRTSLMVAGRLGEQMMRMRESAARHNEAASAQEQRELQNRFDAERLSARAELAPLGRDAWWDQADSKAIVAAWQTASIWRQHDPEIDQIAGRIRSEVQERFGVDAEAPGAHPERVEQHLSAIANAQHTADELREQARKDEMEAAQILLEASAIERDLETGESVDVDADRGRVDKMHEQAAELNQDSQRNRVAADKQDNIAASEAEAAKQVADQGFARPASEATAPSKVKTSRPRGASPAQVQERSVSR